jgi:ABC-type transport system involved in multi-copper enzyme maturation permease subunit
MSGILTVARLELTVRVRAGRWRWLLGGWFAILVIFTLLLRLGIGHAHGLNGSRGTVMYGGLQLFQLALALLVVPALTSQSINGDRERGTLGVLQVTNLTAFDIAAGKLVAAWGTGCIFLLTSAPLVAWSMVDGGVPAVRVVVVTIVVALLLGVVCAISLGLSALVARSTTSSVLSYLAVFGLTVGTLVFFGLATALTVTSQSGARTDGTWVLLAPNPFVVLADAAPVPPPPRQVCRAVPGGTVTNGQAVEGTSEICTSGQSNVDPLGTISRAVRELRVGPDHSNTYVPGPVRQGGLVWPYGLGFDSCLGGFMLMVATRRLRTPRRTLPRGVRLA